MHPGYVQLPNGQKVFAPFPQAQIDALIPLVKDIVKRHAIKPEYILGHGEVTPSYKEDPGPTFPWKLFSDLGITPPWPDAAAVAAQRAVFEAQPPEMLWIQRSLAKHGYQIEPTGVFDKQTERVLMNFQMRYRPGQLQRPARCRKFGAAVGADQGRRGAGGCRHRGRLRRPSRPACPLRPRPGSPAPAPAPAASAAAAL